MKVTKIERKKSFGMGQMMINRALAVLLLFTALSACTTQSTAESSKASDSRNSQPTPSAHGQSQTELANIDAQLAGIEGMIANANARIQSYQSMNTPGRDGMIAGAEAEKKSYESQKRWLMSRKQQLLSEMTSGN